ncbi:putative UDP-galactose 4-epimerase [Seiridium unicorne]|uniref:UDP-galactose 4-epimerase n=1 Tax=Seiridium unicorne TaxID=138068 RepID=A0ABR2UE80_9PEZI
MPIRANPFNSIKFTSIHKTTPRTMKIAITGARGTVGREVVKLCAKEGHETVQINRTDQEKDDTPNTEMRTADAATSYEDTVKAFKGCDAIIHLAAIPNPVGKADTEVFSNNVLAAFNGLRAAAENGIKRFCYASSVNAIGLAYANQPLKFPYFPIDEDYPVNPTDAYALGKVEAEAAARAFPNWFPGMKVACLRIHEVAGRKDVLQEHKENWEDAGVKQLWSWVNPVATARACLLSVTESDKIEGFEIFNILAPDTTQDTPSKDLAAKYYPDVELKSDMSTNRAFWTTEKAERILGWKHHEKE